MTYRVAIGAIVKDEGPYIEEWLDHHRQIGVCRFIIADNGSTDGTFETLEANSRKGDVRVFRHLPPSGIAPQLGAYQRIISEFIADMDWIAFIDADEFFVLERDLDISNVLKSFSKDKSVGAVAVNWACYGSSGLKSASAEAVCSRFKRRAEQNFIANHHYKSVVRVSELQGTRGTPHHFQLSRRSGYKQVDGSDLVFHPQRGEGLSARVVWSPMRINHYAVKSSDEFFQKKGPRGRATVVGQPKGESYFIFHDRNEVFDPFLGHARRF